MRRIAYLTSADMVPGSGSGREDLFELELQLGQLVPALRDRGLELDLRVWDDPELRPADYAAVVVGTTWDYTTRAEEFLDRMDAFAAHSVVLNPPDVLRWNADKRYLQQLAERGVPTIPTAWIDRVDGAAVADARARLGAGEVVIKSVVGACAERQVRLAPGAALPPAEQCPPGAAMVQPFLQSIVEEGEISVIFCGDRPSHALRKRPAAGDYRVQSVYGGREEVVTLSADEDALCRRIIAAVDRSLLYGRVDLVRGADGALKLIELELIEPYLYPEQGPELGRRYAAALEGLLDR